MRKGLLDKYNRKFTEEKFFKENVYFAFSKKQLEVAIQKLGAKDKSELTTIFNIGDICLKSKAKEILEWVNSRSNEKTKWLKSLSTEEASVIVEYELCDHECTYTGNIEPVVSMFENIYEADFIVSVFKDLKK